MYKLEKDQLAGALLYGVSCALAAGGQALFVRGHVQVAAVLLGLAAAAFGVPLRRALKRHASQLEASRGHEPPLPLRRDAAGHWTPTGARPSFWFLLGSFQTDARRPAAAARLRELRRLRLRDDGVHGVRGPAGRGGTRAGAACGQ